MTGFSSVRAQFTYRALLPSLLREQGICLHPLLTQQARKQTSYEADMHPSAEQFVEEGRLMVLLYVPTNKPCLS